MDRKIIVGSIIAVVILVLVSFTGVVGYQTTKSSTIARASPLFSMRTSRAIGEERKDINCNYASKGNMLPFPERDDKTVMVQKVFDSISKMDDKAFERFIASVIDSVQKNNRFNGIKTDRIREALNMVRNSDKPIQIFDADIEKKNHMRNIMYTIQTGCGSWTCRCTIGHGIGGILICIFYLGLLPYAIIAFIISLILNKGDSFIICDLMN